MIVTIERVASFDLRNLLGYDCPEEVLRKHEPCVTASTVIWLGKADGADACAIGVIPFGIFSNKAYLWMIHTRICEQHPLRFIRWSRRVLDEALHYYPHIVGLCKCDSEHSQAWLEWLGAVFDRGSSVDGHYRFHINGNVHLPG